MGQVIDLPSDEAQHAARVLRLTSGTQVELFDGQGGLVLAALDVDAKGRRVAAKALSHRHVGRPPGVLTLATAMPKGPRADILVEQATQLGVNRVVWLTTVRSVATPDARKLDRQRRAVREACKQCRRPYLMHVEGPESLVSMIHQGVRSGESFVAMPGGSISAYPLKQGMPSSDITVFIGPEGGWDPDECEQFSREAVHAWTFSEQILRVETAALAAAALIVTSRSGL